MIRSESGDGVGRLTLARPEVRNALNAEMIAALIAALDAFEEDAAASVVVISGEGSAFSAGADLAAMRNSGQMDAADNRRDARQMGELFHRIAGFPKPVVARVNGPAIGGGVGLLAACDIVVADEAAFFAFSEVRLGLVPAVISPFCMRRLGSSVARRLFLTAERISAAEARGYGLVDIVAAPGALDASVDTVLGGILRGGPCALAEVKRLIDKVAGLDLDTALDYTAECIARLRCSEEAEEGMAAFFEDRPASWVAKRQR